ncbi:hypothetical protein V1525DRAFT_451794 [Lipomyces kononenkoae]|uniref:Uncharacterized protein n=1 Tax=Lipomyces kononenkoae TaxID=34357 RepID=A0ACC3SX98_LIPKO
METNKKEQLIPPTLSITLTPIPPPSRPPTKEDVDRAEHLMNMVHGTLSCLSGRTVTDALPCARFDRQYRDLSDQIRDLMQQSTMQSELTLRTVESMFARRSEVVQSLRQQVIVCIARNRRLTERGQPATEVMFLDGSRPSAQLDANQARQYALRHGIVGRAEIRIGSVKSWE